MRTGIRSILGSVVAVVVATAFAAPAAQAGPALVTQTRWPQFQGNAAHTGTNTSESTLNTENVGGLSLSWIGQFSGELNWASPVIANGSAYLTGGDGGLIVFPKDGCGSPICVPVWRGQTGPQAIATPAVVRGLVYVNSQASLTSNDGRLNVFFANGCGAEVCQPLWQGIGGDLPFLVSSPAVSGGIVYVGSFDGKIYAFDAGGCGRRQCRPLWTGQVGTHLNSSPAVAGGFVYAGSTDGHFAAFDADGCGATECDPLWTATLGGSLDIASPTVAGGRVFVGNGNDRLNVYAATGCETSVCAPLWQGRAPSTENTPAVFNGVVYVDAQPSPAKLPSVGVVEAFDVQGCGQALCAPMWTGVNLRAGGESSPVVANGVVYVGKGPASEVLLDSGVFSYNAAGCGKRRCAPLGFAQTGPEQFYLPSSPAVVDGRVYMGSTDTSSSSSQGPGLYVFELP
jgi:outer membrane protein assembly factor BamB